MVCQYRSPFFLVQVSVSEFLSDHNFWCVLFTSFLQCFGFLFVIKEPSHTFGPVFFFELIERLAAISHTLKNGVVRHNVCIGLMFLVRTQLSSVLCKFGQNTASRLFYNCIVLFTRGNCSLQALWHFAYISWRRAFLFRGAGELYSIFSKFYGAEIL